MHKYKRGITWNNLSFIAQHLQGKYKKGCKKRRRKNTPEEVSKMEETKRLDEVEGGGVKQAHPHRVTGKSSPLHGAHRWN